MKNKSYLASESKSDGGRSFPIVVIGASAGGIEALSKLVRGLSPDFVGSILVVLHTSRFSMLPEILRRHCFLKVEHARDGQALELGQVLIAPPDQHLVINDHHVVLSRGPKQNNVRPAIDPLFKSAARAFGQHVIGVVLSGTLDDGSAGLVAIKHGGGISIVQDPQDAVYQEMPRNALAAVKGADVLTADAIGTRLNKLAESISMKTTAKPRRIRVDEQAKADPAIIPSGKVSTLTCPECGGTLWERHEGNVLRYACHTGHEFAAESLQEAQSDAIERALWVALRALKERAMFVSRLREESRRHGRRHSQTHYQKEEAELKARAELIHGVLLGSPFEKSTNGNRKIRQKSS